MSKAIRSYSYYDQKKVIQRRLQGKTFGIGYWAAVDAIKYTNPIPQTENQTSTDDELSQIHPDNRGVQQ